MSKTVIVIGKNKEDFNALCKNFLFHPLNREIKNVTNLCYEVEAEEGVVALLAFYLTKKEKLTQKECDFLESLDIGYLSSECNIGEEELEFLRVCASDSENVILEVGKDLIAHKRFKNIQAILKILEKSLEIHCDFMLNDYDLEEIASIKENNGIIVYMQESPIKKPLLEVSKQFAFVGKIKNECEVEVNFLDKNLTPLIADLKIREDFKGNVGFLQSANQKSGFCYQQISLKSVS